MNNQNEVKADHSALPWAYRVKQIIGGGRVIACTSNKSTGFNAGQDLNHAIEIDRENKANAALIVRAVNSHEDLVLALRKARLTINKLAADFAAQLSPEDARVIALVKRDIVNALDQA